MKDNQPDLALSCTFKLVDGILLAADQGEQSANVLARRKLTHSAQMTGSEIIDSKYRILALVGEGGMGSVYRVHHMLLGKEMALKTFSDTAVTPDAWQRFQREAQAIAKLTHANIVQVFDFGIGQGDVPYYTMELLSGLSLADKLKSHGRLSLEEALPLFVAVADALSHAHKLSIVHRDVKPANIFLDQGKSGRPVVKVVDFGIAKLVTSQSVENQSQTDIGLVFGSPLYMSPEQSMGAPTDQRTDIYSFGCSLFEVLTGRPPFCGNNAFETIIMHHNKKPPQLVDAAYDVQFSQSAEALVARLLAKDVAKRYQSFDEVLADLSKISAKVGAVEAGRALFYDTAALGQSANPSQDKNKLLLQNTLQNIPENNGQNAQENTALLRSRRRSLVAFGIGLCGLVALSAVIVFFTGTTKSQSNGQRKPAQPVASKAVAEKESYYSTPTADGGRNFNFPFDMIIGYINWEQQKPTRAQGLVMVPGGKKRSLLPDKPLQIHPELFAHFRPDDIAILDCGSTLAQPWNGTELEYITRYLTGLTDLDLTQADIDGKSINQLNRLKQLTLLEVGDSRLTGDDLSRLKRLNKLKWLRADGLKNMHAALEKLRGSHAIHMLRIPRCGLTNEDMLIVATLLNLKGFDLRYNQISAVGLRYLSSLQSLQELEITGMKIGPESFNALSTFKSLRSIELDLVDWPKADLDRLQKALPLCKIQDTKDGKPKTTNFE